MGTRRADAFNSIKDDIAHEIRNPLQAAANAVYLGNVKPEASGQELRKVSEETCHHQ
jgi:hypothetical protein